MNSIYKTLLIGIILLFVGIATSSAQIRFGVKGGVDVINNKISTDILNVNNRLGYYIGPTLEFMAPGPSFGFELSVFYGRKEYELENNSMNASISNYNYISVPLSIKKRFGLSSLAAIFLQVGAFGNVKLEGGNISMNNVVDQYKAKTFIGGVHAGAGLTLLNHLELGMYYRTVLTDNYSEDGPDWEKFNDQNTTNWSVGLTYYF